MKRLLWSLLCGVCLGVLGTDLFAGDFLTVKEFVKARETWTQSSKSLKVLADVKYLGSAAVIRDNGKEGASYDFFELRDTTGSANIAVVKNQPANQAMQQALVQMRGDGRWIIGGSPFARVNFAKLGPFAANKGRKAPQDKPIILEIDDFQPPPTPAPKK